MSGNCRDCQHWEPPERYYNPEWGTCRMAEGENGYEKREGTLAYADDADAYAAGLHTKAEFGCVQWEATTT